VPAKQFQLATVGTVHVYKRKGTRSLRLSISADGKIRITIPAWASYEEGLKFAHSKTGWIQTNLPEQAQILRSGHHIGKAHRLVFESGPGNTVRTRLAGSEVRIIRPTDMLQSHPEVQKAAEKAGIRAMRVEAQKLLPGRLRQLAEMHGFSYNSVQVKQLKGRWGSCDAKKHIVLNLFLMQLPWELIDYVLLHELVHTEHLNHGEGFWDRFLSCEPRAKSYRRRMRIHKPVLKAV
jgi:predicted metal-dependent hydrolase